MKISKTTKEIISVFLQTVLIVGIVVFSVFPFSCKMTAEGIRIIGGDYSAPVLENVNVLNDTTMQISFSEAVTLTDVVVSPVIDGVSNSENHSKTENLSASLAAASGGHGKINTSVTKSEDGKLFTFKFEENTQVGKAYEIYGVVHDDIGNSLTFCAPFIGYNNRIPKVIMTEAQIKYTKATLKTGVAYRSEFIECLVLSKGNMAGIEFVSASDGESKVFRFPAVEVEPGQIFLLHLRYSDETCVDEASCQDFAAASAEYSSSEVMDIWSTNTTARLNDTADVLVLRNSIDGAIMDALMYATDDSTEWKENVSSFAALVEEAGIYDSEDISASCSSTGTTPKKSLQRVDAELIRNQILSGEESDYPIQVTSDSWAVKDVTPGRL